MHVESIVAKIVKNKGLFESCYLNCSTLLYDQNEFHCSRTVSVTKIICEAFSIASVLNLFEFLKLHSTELQFC